MKQFIFPSFVVLFSGILLVIIIPDLSKASVNSPAQQLVHGTVTDYHTGEHLPGVKVFCESTATETYTDFDGMFSLKTDISKDVSLRFDYISYQSTRINDIKAGDEQLQVRLKQ
ncbi:MAG: carboxypeptidase-like regulatory domain-containing protein [Bacteroidales bacterium]|nr:carboxypeptidase-like regulatory domain-containing protein [Bacteroidales bacterium]